MSSVLFLLELHRPVPVPGGELRGPGPVPGRELCGPAPIPGGDLCGPVPVPGGGCVDLYGSTREYCESSSIYCLFAGPVSK